VSGKLTRKSGGSALGGGGRRGKGKRGGEKEIERRRETNEINAPLRAETKQTVVRDRTQ